MADAFTRPAGAMRRARACAGRLASAAQLTAYGPGLIAAASDNDPTTIATLAVVGASTGYRLAWIVVLLLPMLTAVQLIAARVAATTGKGLQELVRDARGERWGLLLLVTVLAVNVITIGADLQAGAAALALILPVDARLFVVPYTVLLALLLARGSLRDIERLLKVVVLLFLAYVGAAVLAQPHWGEVLRDSVTPRLDLGRATIEGALALLGTTLTAYVYVWETIAEAEGGRSAGHLAAAQVDASAGTAFTVAIFWFILVGTGATLGVRHESVQTAQGAAAALRPIAGPFVAQFFAIGLLASSILVMPILVATSGYMLGQQFGFAGGLSRSLRDSRPFYLTLAAALALGAGIALSDIPTVRLLIWASIAGGLGTPIGLVFLLLAARDRSLMGDQRIGGPLLAVGWATALIVSAIGLLFLGQRLLGLP